MEFIISLPPSHVHFPSYNSNIREKTCPGQKARYWLLSSSPSHTLKHQILPSACLNFKNPSTSPHPITILLKFRFSFLIWVTARASFFFFFEIGYWFLYFLKGSLLRYKHTSYIKYTVSSTICIYTWETSILKIIDISITLKVSLGSWCFLPPLETNCLLLFHSLPFLEF